MIYKTLIVNNKKEPQIKGTLNSIFFHALVLDEKLKQKNQKITEKEVEVIENTKIGGEYKWSFSNEYPPDIDTISVCTRVLYLFKENKRKFKIKDYYYNLIKENLIWISEIERAILTFLGKKVSDSIDIIVLANVLLTLDILEIEDKDKDKIFNYIIFRYKKYQNKDFIEQDSKYYLYTSFLFYLLSRTIYSTKIKNEYETFLSTRPQNFLDEIIRFNTSLNLRIEQGITDINKKDDFLLYIPLFRRRRDNLYFASPDFNNLLLQQYQTYLDKIK